jgi:hypothetical protein
MNSDPHQSEPDHPDATAHPPLASATPHPPRRRWLKRIALAVVLFIAGFITLFVIWHRVADQRLQAAIDKIKAAGEPLYPEDFNTPPIPDEDNAAAIVYARIAPLMERFEHSDGRAVLYRCRDLDANNQAFVSTCGTLLASQESAFELLREAQAKPDLRWFVEFKPPLLEIDFSELNLSAFRALSLLLHIRAQDEHRRGRDDLSVETVGQLLSLAEDIDRIPILLAHLVAGSILNRTVDLIQELIPNLNSLEIEQQVDRQPADRAAVESILNRLLDDAPARENIAQAFRYERATQLDSFYIVMGRSSARATNAANRSGGSDLWSLFRGRTQFSSSTWKACCRIHRISSPRSSCPITARTRVSCGVVQRLPEWAHKTSLKASYTCSRGYCCPPSIDRSCFTMEQSRGVGWPRPRWPFDSSNWTTATGH